MSYSGNRPATKDGVIRYLVEELEVNPGVAFGLVGKHQDILDSGARLGSFDYYVGDEIARAEGIIS